VDVAFAAGADGAHLPSDGLPVEAVRRVLGDDAVVGQAIHDPAEATSARAGDVDYLMLGTVFPSRSHPDGAAIGLSAVERAAAGTVPILAVGGIEPDNAGRVIAAGAHGVAVISSILTAPDPTEAARRLKAEVREAWARRTETSLAGSR
jgi:thiamine-phosphate pyrophosphorylase